jgi:excisionase family DNA binding protein
MAARKLAAKELAEALGVTADTVRRWADDGRIPCLRAVPGGRLMFDLAEVEAALRARHEKAELSAAAAAGAVQ